MDETVAYSSLKHTRSRKAIAVPYFEDLKARRGRGCGWRVVLTWRMDGYMHALQISDHLRETAGGVVMQCDIWVVFRVSISSDCKDTTRGEKQKQFFAGVIRSPFGFSLPRWFTCPYACLKGSVGMFEGTPGHALLRCCGVFQVPRIR